MLFHVIVVCLPAADAGRQAGAVRLGVAPWLAMAGQQAGAEQYPKQRTCGGVNQKVRNRSRISRFIRNRVKIRI